MKKTTKNIFVKKQQFLKFKKTINLVFINFKYFALRSKSIDRSVFIFDIDQNRESLFLIFRSFFSKMSTNFNFLKKPISFDINYSYCQCIILVKLIGF